MSVPPPNHHCPGMPFHSCRDKSTLAILYNHHLNLKRVSAICIPTLAHLSLEVSVVEVHGGCEGVVWVHDGADASCKERNTSSSLQPLKQHEHYTLVRSPTQKVAQEKDDSIPHLMLRLECWCGLWQPCMPLVALFHTPQIRLLPPFPTLCHPETMQTTSDLLW